jgi:hypothetical protein
VERARVTLTYSQKDVAQSCPDEATFRSLVAARLGYDPFVADGTLALEVALSRRGKEIVGRLILTGEDRQKRGERTLRSGADECFELATSMALAAAVAVDPEAVQNLGKPPAPEPKPEPEPSPKPKPPLAPPGPPPRKPPAPPPPADDFHRGVRFELGGLLPVGIVPAPRGGVRLGVALDVPTFSIGVEGAFLFPSARDSSFGEVSAYVVHGSLVPCVHPPDLGQVLLNLCVVGSVGAMRSTASGVTRAEPATDLFATVGPRLGSVVMLSRSFGLGAHAEMPFTLSRVHLDIDDGGRRREVWASSRVGFVGGLSLVARLR